MTEYADEIITPTVEANEGAPIPEPEPEPVLPEPVRRRFVREYNKRRFGWKPPKNMMNGQFVQFSDQTAYGRGKDGALRTVAQLPNGEIVELKKLSKKQKKAAKRAAHRKH